MLIFVIITTQSLQLVGMMEPPKTLEQITYPQQNQYDYQLAIVNNEVREKRQTDFNEDRSQFIDSLFNKQFGQGITSSGSIRQKLSLRNIEYSNFNAYRSQQLSTAFQTSH
ncbi:hypothetical protein HHI36_009476 [Cryptolaemus montrouzieri]|uniref:Uncharacterized protein n=1 Tax=Cryptolaemus montrouzieri TaxID=559131 RepID=A0ABD2MFS2_9CUCU